MNRWPHEHNRLGIRTALGARSDAELGFYITRRTRGSNVVSAARLLTPRLNDAFEAALTKEDEAHRRQFLRNTFGMATAVAAEGPSRLERLRPGRAAEGRLLEALESMAVGGSRAESVESIGELVTYYRQAVCVTDPQSLYREIFAVRCYAAQLLDDASDRHVRNDLTVIVGWLSNLMAIVTNDLGDHAASLLWCADATRRGTQSGLPVLSSWASYTRALIAYYRGRPDDAVAHAQLGQRSAPVGTVAHAKLAAHEMRCWAMLGDVDRMTLARQRAMDAMADVNTDAPRGDVFGMKIADDPPYTATSLLLLHNFRDAAKASQRVIDMTYDPNGHDLPSGFARAQLILGLSLAGIGQLDGAVAAGEKALATSRPAWPTVMLAGRLDRALTHRRGGSAAIRRYHQRYLEATHSVPSVAENALDAFGGAPTDDTR